jgi:gluconokinase
MVILIMGVSGSGKTSIGKLLAEALGWQFEDADSFHSTTSVEKMSRGIPLTDSDRLPWLKAMQCAISEWLQSGTDTVLACSALKVSYRQYLLLDSEQVRLVYLKGSPQLIRQRLNQRQGHYMKADLLQSQFETLEEPEDALTILIEQTPAAIVQQIIAGLKLPSSR